MRSTDPYTRVCTGGGRAHDSNIRAIGAAAVEGGFVQRDELCRAEDTVAVFVEGVGRSVCGALLWGAAVVWHVAGSTLY